MKPKTLLLMLVAIGCGLVAAIAVMNYAQPSTNQSTSKVLVAAVDMKMGSVIVDPDKQLELRDFLKGSEPPNAYVIDLNKPTDIKDKMLELKGKILARTLTKGDAITPRDLHSIQSLLANLPEGMRAITVRATIESALHGFIMPGAHVDVLCTVTPLSDQRRTFTKIFLQDVQVLAVNTISSKPEESVVNNPVTVTLAVKPEDAERVSWVTSRSIVTMALRKPNDDKKIDTKGTMSPFEKDLDGNGGGLDGQTVDVPVAQQDIQPGTPIDGFDKFFKMVKYPKSLAEDAITNPDQLKQITQFLAKGTFPTKAHIQASLDLPGPGGKTEPQVETMIINEGAKPPRAVNFPVIKPAGKAEELPLGKEKSTPPKNEGSEGK